jgi:hypothetical protein
MDYLSHSLNNGLSSHSLNNGLSLAPLNNGLSFTFSQLWTISHILLIMDISHIFLTVYYYGSNEHTLASQFECSVNSFNKKSFWFFDYFLAA